MTDRAIARLRERFPHELQTRQAVFELRLDNNSKLLFLPLPHGLDIQLWQPGTAPDGHGFLLSGSVMLTESDVDRLIDSLVLKRRQAS